MKKIKTAFKILAEGVSISITLFLCMIFIMVALPIGMVVNLVVDLIEGEKNQIKVDFDKE